MTTEPQPPLHPSTSPEPDLRGRAVHDVKGEHLGKVVEVLVDEVARVRFLLVDHAGLLGHRERSYLPADAIARITDDEVHLAHSRDHVVAGPAYSPDLADDPEHQARVCEHYGCSPFWGAGHVSAASPYLT